MGTWENMLRVLKVYMRGMKLEREMWKKEDCWNFMMKKSCEWQARDYKRKITYSTGGCGIEMAFVFVEKKKRKHVEDAKSIPWELQHKLVVLD